MWYNALVAQRQEATDLGSVQCGFESLPKHNALVAELADASDSKSYAQKACGFDPHREHKEAWQNGYCT